MAKFKKDDIVHIVYEGDNPLIKKYNNKCGRVHYVDERNAPIGVSYTVLVPDMFPIYVEEKWLKNANSWERWNYAYDLTSTTSGKLYSDEKFVADVADGNKIDQIFFDEFVTKEDKENNTMRFEDETIVKISGAPGFKSRDTWGVIKSYYGNGKYGVYSLDKPMKYYGIFDEKCCTAYKEVMHDPDRLIKPDEGHLAILTNTKRPYLCKIISVSFEPNSRPEYDLTDIDCGDVFCHRIYKEDFILVEPIKRNYKDEIVDTRNLTPTPAYFLRNNIARPKKVIFSSNRTVVLWSDGDKTIVKASCEPFDREKGLAMAIAKKMFGTNPSKSNYYDVFKKWIPEELIEQHEIESKPKDFPMNPPEEEERPWDSSMRHQISEEIVDKILEGADTEDIKKSIEKSKKILDAEKRGVRPSISGYFVPEPSERGPIQNFVEKFYPGYFPAEFIAFCKKHNLGFVVDGKIVSPYEVKWQNVAGFLRRGVIAMKKKINPSDGHEYMAVDMEKMLFQRLPRNTKDDKEEVKND